jgi:hypothetical protein
MTSAPAYPAFSRIPYCCRFLLSNGLFPITLMQEEFSQHLYEVWELRV